MTKKTTMVLKFFLPCRNIHTDEIFFIWVPALTLSFWSTVSSVCLCVCVSVCVGVCVFENRKKDVSKSFIFVRTGLSVCTSCSRFVSVLSLLNHNTNTFTFLVQNPCFSHPFPLTSILSLIICSFSFFFFFFLLKISTWTTQTAKIMSLLCHVSHVWSWLCLNSGSAFGVHLIASPHVCAPTRTSLSIQPRSVRVILQILVSIRYQVNTGPVSPIPIQKLY